MGKTVWSLGLAVLLALPATQVQEHEVTVTLKLIQVIVTDPQGNPVTDLDVSEFRLFDNGKPQTITDFERHLLPSAKGREKTALAETAVPAAREVTATRMNRKFFLLLDQFQNDLQGFKQAKQAALHFIDTQVQPSDEIALLSYSQNEGMIVHEYLSTDHAKVAARLDKARGLTSRTLNDFATELDMPVEEIENPDTEWEKMKIRQFAQDMMEFGKALRSIPGFKHIILFSAGVSRQKLYDGLYDTPVEGMPRVDSGIRVLFDDMTKELASSSSPIYTVNTLGTRAHMEEHGSRGDDSLKMVSEVTGGIYFEDVTARDRIAETIQNVTGNYYVLGYSIDETWDGKFHAVRVEVTRPGCRVFAQAGYYNPKPFTEYSEVEKRLQLLELALSERARMFDAETFVMRALPCSDPPRSNLVLLSEIPPRGSLVAASGRAEIVTLVFDPNNTLVASQRGEIDFAALTQPRSLHYALLSLDAGRYLCRTVIRNLKTGKGAVAAAAVLIPEPVTQGIRVFPPLPLLAQAGTGYMRVGAEDTGRRGDRVTLQTIYPFPADQFAPLVGELPKEARAIQAVVRTVVAGTWSSEVTLELGLQRLPSGAITRLPFTELEAVRDMAVAHRLEIQLPELEPGEYELRVRARDTVTGTSDTSSVSFAVK